MRARSLTSSAAASMLVACVSLNPIPPARPGAEWVRHELSEGRTPRERTISQGFIRSRASLSTPLPLEDALRYTLELEVDVAGAQSLLHCEQVEPTGSPFVCASPQPTPRSWRLSLDRGCLSGTVSFDGLTLAIRPWFKGRVHVGFLLTHSAAPGRDNACGSPTGPCELPADESPVAAVDTDHQERLPFWTVTTLSPDHLVGVELTAFVLDDVFRAEALAGVPFLCRDLSWTRRSPR